MKTPAELNKEYAASAAIIFDLRRRAIEADLPKVAADLLRHYEQHMSTAHYWATIMEMAKRKAKS